MTKPHARSVFAVAFICLLGLAALAGIPDGGGASVSSYEKQAVSAAYFQWHHDNATTITFTAFGPDTADYSWDFGDGTAGSSKTVTHTFPLGGAYGTYTVTLTVTRDGGTSSNARTLTVSGDPPVPDFTWEPETPTTQTEVQFWDTSIDPGNEIQNWTWDFDDGALAYGPSVNHTFADSGIHNVTLTISNATSGLHQSVTKQIFVFNMPPVARFYWTKKNGAIQFTAATAWENYSRDIDGSIVNYTWSFGDGNTSYAQNPTHVYATNDTYPVSLTVRDNDGATDTITRDVATDNYLPDAEAFIHPTEATIRTHVTFNDSSVDMDGEIVNRTWTFGDGTVSHERNATHRYSEKGVFTVTLTVIDDASAYNTTTRQVEVVNLPPDIFVSWNPVYPAVDEPVTFVNYSAGPGDTGQHTTDLDGYITNQTWRIDGQTAGYGPNVTHVFSTNGIHTVTLEVTDDSGDTNQSTRQVHVADIYVDDNASEEWYDHSHVRTIQEGVDNASAGNLIHVLPGTYREQVMVETSVTITADEAVADGVGGTAFTVAADDTTLHELSIVNASQAVEVTADNVTVTDCHLTSDAGGVRVTGSYVHVSSNTFTGQGEGAGAAVWIEGSHASVTYNTFLRTSDAVAVADGSGHVIRNNSFAHQIIHAVEIQNADGCFILNNTVTDTHLAIDVGSQDCRVEGNTLRDNHKAIRLHAAGTTVYNNTLTGNTVGVEVTGANNTIAGTVIGGSQHMAINLSSSSGTEIAGCTLHGNTVGVNAVGSGHAIPATIHNVTFSQTAEDSIALYNAAATIDACIFSDVSRGISINRSADVTVRSCVFVNGTTGVSIEEAAPTVERCDISGFSHGLFSRGHGVDIARCTVHNNTVGLLLQGENATLTGSWITDNDRGVSARGVHNLTVTATVSDNGCGVLVEGGAHVSIVEALFANNTDAVSLEDTQDVTVTGCSIETSDTAVTLVDASGCRIVDNMVHDNHIAVTVLTASHNTFSGNNLSRNHGGFIFSRAPFNTLRDNTMVDNDYAIDLEGRSVSHYYQDIDTSNEVNGQPVHYVTNQSDVNGSALAPDGRYGYLGFVSCDNVTVTGPSTEANGEGLLLVDTYNVSIEQGTFTRSRDGVVLFASSSCSITGTNVSGNTDDGIIMTGGTHTVSVTACTIAGNGQRGINLYRSTGGPGRLRISDSHVEDNWLGVNIENADSVVIENLTLSGNTKVAIRLYRAADISLGNVTLHGNGNGLEVLHADATLSNVTAHHHDTAVTVTDGTAVVHGGVLRDNDVGVAATRATVTVTDAVLHTHSTAILADNATTSAAATAFESNTRALHVVSSAVTVDRCSITGNVYGVLLDHTDEAYIGNCTDAAALANNTYGISVNHSRGATVTNCSLSGNENAITVTASSGTSIDGCRLSNNTDAVTVVDANHTALNGSLLHHNVYALDIRSNLTTVTRCSFWKNMYGVRILAGRNNSIYHNNFAYNMEQAFDAGVNNSWDNGYPSGGNYWSNYAGTDDRRGAGQNKSGSDGIGDIPFPIAGGTATDAYPFMEVVESAAAIPNSPPQAAFFVYPPQPLSGDAVDFVDQSTDPNGKSDIVGWTWTFGDGASSSLQHPSHVYDQPGNYTVTLTVTDSHGRSRSRETNVTVTNTPPVAHFTASPQQPAVGETIKFTSDSRDDNGEIVNWSWTFGDGSMSSQQHPSHSYSSAGTYTVSLTVTDDDGATDTYTMDITSSGTPPTAGFSFTPSQPTAGTAVSFTDLSTDDGSIVTWHWEFGDGNASAAQNPSYTYEKAGTYTVTLTVWDDDGARNTTTRTVTVTKADDTPGFALPLLLLAMAVAAVVLLRRRGKV